MRQICPYVELSGAVGNKFSHTSANILMTSTLSCIAGFDMRNKNLKQIVISSNLGLISDIVRTLLISVNCTCVIVQAWGAFYSVSEMC